MKFDKLMAKVKGAEDKYGINPISLMIIDYVLEEEKVREVTIMNLLESFWRTSRATTHKYFKKLVAKKIFVLKRSKVDGRVKIIEKGSKFDEFIAYMEE